MAETPAYSVNAQAQTCVPRTARKRANFMIHAISSPFIGRIEIPQCSHVVPPVFAYFGQSNERPAEWPAEFISAFRVGRRVQRDAGAWESEGRRIGFSSNTLKWRSRRGDRMTRRDLIMLGGVAAWPRAA